MAHSIIAQNTVGVLQYEEAQTATGYNLIFPFNQPNTYLIDNCGRIVHSWLDEPNFRPGASVYLMEDGRLLRTKKDFNILDDLIGGGGGGEIVEIVNWDNTIESSIRIHDPKYRAHHDVEAVDKGTHTNVLILAWHIVSKEEAIMLGRDSSLIDGDFIKSEIIFEWDPIQDSVVWEWRVIDHLIQNENNSISNYGEPIDHPEKVNFNFTTNGGNADWLHFNSIDYNPILDQIVISVPGFNEFWIIDHSTTTLEAATDVGGTSGKGGDLLYRYGNPRAYDNGDMMDQKLYFQHDVHWTNPKAIEGDDDFGEILLFNNRLPQNDSECNYLQLSYDPNSKEYQKLSDGTFGPEDFARTLVHPTDSFKAYSISVSSAQKLNNNNTLIFSGRWGYAYEMTPSDSLVWEYLIPINNGVLASQGDELDLVANITFRMKRYNEDFPGLVGKDLAPGPFLELNPSNTFCESVDLTETALSSSWRFSYKRNERQICLEMDSYGGQEMIILNVMAQKVLDVTLQNRITNIDVSHLPIGRYVIVDGKGLHRKSFFHY